MGKRLLALGLVAFACAAAPVDAAPQLRLDHVQAEGSHNSYHQAPPWSLLISEWDYSHSPLDVQLADEGVRQLEIDVHYREGGFVVYHVAGFDHFADCDGDGDREDSFVECLETLVRFSQAHPDHHPVVVHVETKDAFEEQFLDLRAQKMAGHYDELDAEIRSVMGSRIVTPDEVQGDHTTLREALTTDGWPAIDETRGRFYFVLLDGGEHREAYSGYSSPDPSLGGRAMFVEAASGDMDHPLTAITRIDEPRGNEDLIGSWVEAGFLVRTRADADGREARGCIDLPEVPLLPFQTEPCPIPMEPDTSRLEAALASGAQFISTDFPDGDRLGNGYSVEIPGGTPSRCNPVTAPPGCTSEAIEPG